MKNQFFYTRREVSGGTPEAPEYRTFTDSFNMDKVIRSISLEDDRVLVLLDDLHERAQLVPDVDPKTNKVRGQKRERNVYQSEIYLEQSDAKRFYELTSIN
jgi:hypothetical protein